MSDTTPAISVVISTYNRAALLGDAIESVLSQVDAPPFDLTVVDNNSTDDTRAVVERLIPGSNGRLRYVFEGRQGVSYGRNAGIAATRGAIIAFTDDDVRARPDWLARIAAAFEAHPWADFVGGKVLPRWPGPVPAWLTPEHWGPLALIDYAPEPVRVDLERPICLVSANLAVRRATVERVGGFDPAYQHIPGSVTACEDHEWELRVLRAGGAGLYTPDVVLEADVQPNRLGKAYHRKWHFDHGVALTRMLGPDQTFNARMVPVAAAGGRRRMLFGAAPWVYRSLVVHAARAVVAWLGNRRDAAFLHELHARDMLGHVVGRSRGLGTAGAPAPRVSAARPSAVAG